MGRFARSNTTTGTQAKITEPQRSISSWAEKKSGAQRRHQSRNKSERRVFRLVMLVALIVIGASSGWLIGRTLIGSSHENTLQSAGVIEASSRDTGAAGDTAKDQASDPEVAANEQPAVEDEQLSNRGQTEQQGGSTGGRRYAKGKGFQPTSIVTKPARIISKPLKKLNPLKIF